MSAYTNLQKRIERVKAEPYGRKSFMVRVDEVAELLDLVREQHEALDKVAEHVEELEEAWRRGLITEPPRAGGTRSNRNVAVRAAVRRVLESGIEAGVGGSRAG